MIRCSVIVLNQRHGHRCHLSLQGVMSDSDQGVADGVVASNDAQAAAIWAVREGIAESLGRRGE
jgi:hypothetical protein